MWKMPQGTLELRYNLQTWTNNSCLTSHREELRLNKESIFVRGKLAEMLDLTYNGM